MVRTQDYVVTPILSVDSIMLVTIKVTTLGAKLIDLITEDGWLKAKEVLQV
jgi:hypothetical protein